ncbi:VOC family protein [Rhodococcus erythropolis]|uniref:VOC family protein n=1 Tax=Rhodococcus erythropolis TaxID=1833 RepID=UPI0015C47851|nr:VOC family protein [Rhodococcus erythropolis]
MIQTPGIHHIALTVSDLDASVKWYEQVFGIGHVMDVPHHGKEGIGKVLADNTFQLVIGLHRHAGNPGSKFSETQSGLDHVSFRVSSPAELAVWSDRLADLGVRKTDVADRPLTQSPIVSAAYGSILAFRDPDNIALELIAVPSV